MPIDMNIRFAGSKAGLVKLPKVSRQMQPNLERGMKRGGMLLEGQIKRNLSKGRPGLRVITGRLRASVTTKFARVSGGPQVKIGPNVVYAAIHEFGGMAGRGHNVRIPARPYVKPAVKEKLDKVVSEIRRQIMRPMK